LWFISSSTHAVCCTYRIQSIATMSEISSGGKPTEVSTITMVTRPACGIPAAPMLAAVAVILRKESAKSHEAITGKYSFVTVYYRSEVWNNSGF